MHVSSLFPRIFLLLLAFLVCSPQGSAANPGQEPRTALLIGNGDYKETPLKNPVNDVNDLAEALKKCGFSVNKLINADRRGMRDAIRAFGRKLNTGGGVGLFFYAGHGMQVKGENYLVPVGARVFAEDEVVDECVRASAVLRKMETAGNRLNIIILDACRNSPFDRRFRSARRGLAEMDAPRGSIITYATAPGSMAADSDGSGGNGLYTSKLLRHILTPGLEIGLLFRKVRADVINASNSRQVPWESSSLTGEFYFVQSSGFQKEKPAPPPTPKPQEGWLTVKSNVPKADIRINGKDCGKTPRTFTIRQEGLYRVQVEKAGYHPYQTQVKMKLGMDQTVSALLDKIADEKPSAPAAPAVSHTPDKKAPWIDRVTGMTFVWIPEGCFRMGSQYGYPEERTVHEVCLDGFWMGKYEVTVGQWRAFIRETGYRTQAETGDGAFVWTGFKWEQKKDANWRHPYYPFTREHPLTCVSWHDARAFSKWLSQKHGAVFRLPTEAEWEYACRAGKQTERPWGNRSEGACRYANVADRSAKQENPEWKSHDCDDGYAGAAPVGRFKPNAFGLHDMIGNVMEWCLDIYNKDAYQQHGKRNPVFGASGADLSPIYADRYSDRVIRGGSWSRGPSTCRSCYRNGDGPSRRYYDLGIRLIREE